MKNSPILKRAQGESCKVAVLGYGVSNRPLVEWLLAHGISPAQLTVRDRREPGELAASGDAARLRALGVPVISGAGYLARLDGTGVIFRTPGIRPDLPALAAAVAHGACLTSEMELFLELTEAAVLGVTGSDGKTTTTTVASLLVADYLQRRGYGRMYLGGNIGTPLLPLVDEMTADDVAVLELSSFQLMTMRRSPDRAAVTNLSPNHLNWHTDMAEYRAAKANICTHMRSADPLCGAVLNAENPDTRALGLSLPPEVPVTWFSSAVSGWKRVVPPERQGGGTRDSAVFAVGGTVRSETRAEGYDLLDVSRMNASAGKRMRLETLDFVGKESSVFADTEKIRVRITWRVSEPFAGVHLKLNLHFRDSTPVGITHPVSLGAAVPGKLYTTEFEFDPSLLGEGQYFFYVDVFDGVLTQAVCLDKPVTEFAFEVTSGDLTMPEWAPGWGRIHFPPVKVLENGYDG